jgi:hypothetical protein
MKPMLESLEDRLTPSVSVGPKVVITPPAPVSHPTPAVVQQVAPRATNVHTTRAGTPTVVHKGAAAGSTAGPAQAPSSSGGGGGGGSTGTSGVDDFTAEVEAEFGGGGGGSGSVNKIFNQFLLAFESLFLNIEESLGVHDKGMEDSVHNLETEVENS